MSNISFASKACISLFAAGAAGAIGTEVAQVFLRDRLNSLPPEAPARTELRQEQANLSSASFVSLCVMTLSGIAAAAKLISEERQARGVIDSGNIA